MLPNKKHCFESCYESCFYLFGRRVSGYHVLSQWARDGKSSRLFWAWFKFWEMHTRSALSASTIRKPFKFQIQREQWAFQKLKSAIYVLNPKKGVSCITVLWCQNFTSLSAITAEELFFWSMARSSASPALLNSRLTAAKCARCAL